MASMTGAQALVRSLAREGVEVVFALPGVQIMDAFDALHDEPGIRLVTVRHEQSTTFMADGYARTTGKVGVGLVVPGPGALNATAGLGTAYATSSPVLLICGQIESYNLGKERGALHEVEDLQDVFRPITKWCSRIMSVEAIPEGVHEAMRRLGTGRPRPVELEVPWDVLPRQGDAELPEAEVFPGQPPDPSKIQEAADLLANARRPLIWAGGGAIRGDASHEVAELADALNAPVITTHQGKGIIPETSPLSLGTFYSGHGPGQRTLPQCDVILAVGSRLHLTPKVSWAFQPHQKLIHIDADPEELGRNHATSVGIVADSKVGLRALLQKLEGGSSEWSPAELAAIKDDTYREIEGMAPLQVEIIETLRRELEDDAIVVAGTTDVGYWSYLAFPVLRPHSYLTSSYFATLGFSFPTAVGAKIGNPHRQVVALCGDGGFMYGVPDLTTAVQERANLVSLVFNNGSYGASLSDQQTRFGGREHGTRFHNPDFARMAESFGAVGVKLGGPAELGGALRDALKADAPVVIDVPMPVLTPPFQITPRGLA
ncbi:MAG: thiamine pyrophosphate-binding protein [Dehalococcoidia bacterium]|nr:thiamine pyrophosphate-binding protein [Dehalococcoidia bacterium]